MYPVFTSPAKKKGRKENTIAIGVNKYEELVKESTVFIDKSLLIKEFLENASKVLLVTCPRRWGKSINMDMIKTFLEIQVDAEGQCCQNKTYTSRYKLFTKGEIDLGDAQIETFNEPLHISKHQNIIDKYQGEYPVILVDFKNAKGSSYDEILNGVKLAISNTFQKYSYMIDIFDEALNNTSLKRSERKRAQDSLAKFERLSDNEGQNATDVDIQDSLKFLSELLHKQFGKRVYVLMDEYDAPINNALRSKEFSDSDLDKTLLLFRSIMGSLFKGNGSLEKGLITGVFRIAKASIFSDLNNLTEYNFLNNEFAKYYGFNESEVNELFAEYNISSKLFRQAKDWYDGYRVTSDKNLKIYNPWSVVKFLDTYKKRIPEEQHLAIQNYWEESGSIDFISDLFKIKAIKDNVLSLINSKGDVLINLDGLKFSQRNFKTLKKLLNSYDNYKIDKETVDLFLTYIFAAGYLTIKKEHYDSTYICLPNNEVKHELAKKLKSYYQKIYKVSPKLFNEVTDKLEQLFKDQGANTFKKAFQELIGAFPPFIDIKRDIGEEGIHGNEDLVHSILNCAALQIRSISQFGTEVWYKNEFRADVVLVNKQEKLGVVIELKYEGSADNALEQAKTYKDILSTYENIERVKYVGINVTQNKEVDVKYEIEDLLPQTTVTEIQEKYHGYNLRSRYSKK